MTVVSTSEIQATDAAEGRRSIDIVDVIITTLGGTVRLIGAFTYTTP